MRVALHALLKGSSAHAMCFASWHCLRGLIRCARFLHLVHRDGNYGLRWQGGYLHTDIPQGSVRAKAFESICSVEVESRRVDNDE